MPHIEPPSSDPELPAVVTRCILMVDIVESVRLMHSAAQQTTRDWVRFYRRTRDEWTPKHKGTLVKSLGDGMMIGFEHARDALACAFELHGQMAGWQAEQAAENPIWLRCGLHFGEVTITEFDWLGPEVNVASRVATLARPGETVATIEARDLLVDGLDAHIEDLGECFFKHLPDPLRAYRIHPLRAARGASHAAGELPPTPDATLRPALCVLPFAGEQQQHGAAFGDLVASEVNAALSRLSGLDVISRLSARAAATRSPTPQALRQLLGAHYVISGSCMTVGSEIRMDVELAETRSGHTLWVDVAHDTQAALLAGRSQAVETIARKSAQAILQHELSFAGSLPIHSIDNHTLLLNGIQLLHRNSRAHYQRSRELLEALAQRQPRHPAPRAWLAKWHVIALQQGWAGDPADTARQAQDHSRRALDLDPGDSLALTADGLVQVHYHRRLDLARERYDAALAANPNEPLAWANLGMLHAFLGQGVQAVAATQRALRLAPLDPMRYYYETLAASAAASARDFDQALVWAERSLRGNALHTSTLRVMAISQQMLGQTDAARATAQRLMTLEPGFNLRRFRARGPGADSDIGREFARALEAAGVPD